MHARPAQLAEQLSAARTVEARPVEMIRLPIDAARRKAREIIGQTPDRGFVRVVENWRLAGNGEVEFTVRRLRSAD